LKKEIIRRKHSKESIELMISQRQNVSKETREETKEKRANKLRGKKRFAEFKKNLSEKRKGMCFLKNIKLIFRKL